MKFSIWFGLSSAWFSVFLNFLDATNSTGNFTLVIVALYNSPSYADMRIIGPGMELAMAEVRQIYPRLTGSSMEVAMLHQEFQNSCGDLQVNVADTAAKMYYDKLNSTHPIAAFLGTTCTFADQAVLDLLTQWNLPLMEGSSLAAFIADRQRYPLAMGFSFTQMRAGEFFYRVIRYFNWTTVTGLYDKNDINWEAMVGAFDFFKTRDDVRWELISLLLTNISTSVYDAHRKSRVTLIMATPAMTRKIMLAAHQLGYTNGDHVYIAGAYFKTKFVFGMPVWNLNESTDMDARTAFRSLFLVRQHVMTSEKYQAFARTVEQMSLDQYNQSITPYDEVNIHSMAYHDAILAYSEVVNEVLETGGDIFDGRKIVPHFTNRTFSGIRGNFTLDSQNNVRGHFELWNFRHVQGEFMKILDFPETATSVELVGQVEWASDAGVPPDRPRCWFDGNNPECLYLQNGFSVLYWFFCAIGVALCFLFVAWLVNREMNSIKLRKTLGGWELDRSELHTVVSVMNAYKFFNLAATICRRQLLEEEE